MQILHEHNNLVRDFANMNVNINPRNVSSHNIEVKEKRSSDASLRLMHPVASGDNMATDLNSIQKLKDESPTLIPCCEGRELEEDSDKRMLYLRSQQGEGRELEINEELVRSGLSAISMKHESAMQCLNMSRASEKIQVCPGLVKHRNSFRSLHRPDLKRVPYLRRMTPDELETLFRGYSDFPIRSPISAGNKSQEHRNGCDDIPSRMKLHGVRARLYTSVLAGANAGNQLENTSATEDYDATVPEVVVPEDELQLNEELQIILPPRCEDNNFESCTSTSTEKKTRENF